MKVRQTGLRIWAIPIAIGTLSSIGLTTALLADGYGDVLSWLTLSVPVLITVWGFFKRS